MKTMKRWLALTLAVILVASNAVYSMSSSLKAQGVTEGVSEERTVEEAAVTQSQVQVEDNTEGVDVDIIETIQGQVPQEKSTQETLGQATPEEPAAQPEESVETPEEILYTIIVHKPAVDGGAMKVWTTGEKIDVTYDEAKQYKEEVREGTTYYFEITAMATHEVEQVTDEKGNMIAPTSIDGKVYTYEMLNVVEDKALTVAYKEIPVEAEVAEGAGNGQEEHTDVTVARTTQVERKPGDGKKISFDINGGTGEAPSEIEDTQGSVISLPGYDGSKGEATFVGWSTNPNATSAGIGNYKTRIYAPGEHYTLDNTVKLYAVWASSNLCADFYIRKNGTIPDEPGSYATSGYTNRVAHIENAVKQGRFIADVTGAKVQNNLNQVPTEAQIKTALQGTTYNSETYYILWYVIKLEGGHDDNAYNVDGVVLEKQKVTLTYVQNVPGGGSVDGENLFPVGSQFVKGASVTPHNGKGISSPGYKFTGWNTQGDGQGNAYAPGEAFTINNDITLYAQWSALEGTAYTIEYYLQDDEGKYQEAANTSTKGKGTTGANIKIAPPHKSGYTYDSKNTNNVLGGVIQGDGTLTLKLYYKLNKATASVWFYRSNKDPSPYIVTKEDALATEGTNKNEKKVTQTNKKGYSAEDISRFAQEACTLTEETDRYREQSYDIWVPRKDGSDTWILLEKDWSNYEIMDQDSIRYHVVLEGQHQITYQAGKHSSGVGITKSEYQGGVIPNQTAEDAQVTVDSGYRFVRWKQIEGNGTLKEDGFEVGNGNAVLEAVCEKNDQVTKQLSYQVEYYKDDTEVVGDKKTITRDVWINDTEIPVQKGDIDYTKYEGYTFDKTAPTSVGETVQEGSVVKVYYTANEDTAYEIQMYYEQKGTYQDSPTATISKSGTTAAPVDTTAHRTPEEFRGNYVYDSGKSSGFEQGVVAGDGSLVLKVYFKQQFTVTYEPGTQGTFETQKSTNLAYGAKTPALQGTIAGNDGYSFGGWTPSVAETISGDARYVAQWVANSETKYRVEYYYESNGIYADATETSIERSGTTGVNAAVTEEDKSSAEAGYVYDADATNVLEGTIAGNGSLVLKVYFKQQFTVTYTKGDQGTFEEKTTASLSYGDETPSFSIADATGNLGYSFSGWTPSVAEHVTGDVEYVAQWKANEDTAYEVEHYQEDVDGNYVLEETQELEGQTGAIATAQEKSYTGFVFAPSVEGTLTEGTIVGNGSLVLKLYYTRNRYTVSYQVDGTPLGEQESYLFGADVAIRENASKAGYTFSGWSRQENFIMPARNIEITGTFEANKDTKYRVEYYYESNGIYADATETSIERSGTTGVNAAVTEEDKSSADAGYVYDESAANVLNGIIAGNGSLVLKVYFKQQFTVTYTKGDQGTFEEKTTASLSYGDETPSFSIADATGNLGYSFSGWTPSVAEHVTGDVEYVAQWKANEDTAYEVEHYQEDVDGNYVLEETQELEGQTGAIATAQEKSYTGFVFDPSVEGTLTEGTIVGNGSLVLKLYYVIENSEAGGTPTPGTPVTPPQAAAPAPAPAPAAPAPADAPVAAVTPVTVLQTIVEPLAALAETVGEIVEAGVQPLVQSDDEGVPLANRSSNDHKCCILHLLILLLALLVEIGYIGSMKRRQKRIMELREEIALVEKANADKEATEGVA